MKRQITMFTALAIATMMFFAAPTKAKQRVPVLRLSTTTSTVDSGLLDYILPAFEQKYEVNVEAISVGTGKALKLGENGDVDVVLVHVRSAEDDFVNAGFGVNRRDVMYNDFLIVGTPDDPADIKGIKVAEDTFRKIADKRKTFISRGDKSGTDMKEKEIWKKAGIKPEGKWYVESGQGMGATLTMSDELGAYTLVDRATYLSYKAKTQLVPLVEGSPALLNPYGIIAVNPKRYKGIKYDLAMKFIDWMTSDEGQALIGSYKMKGVQLFIPDAKKK